MNDKNINSRFPELARLLEDVEKKYGRPVRTSTDFESLSVVIEREIGEYISSATLKRIWGYVSLHPTPRFSTLDVLSKFLGYHSFVEYREALMNDPNIESTLFSTAMVISEQLEEGTTVIIGWNPNRLVTLRYLGNMTYQVESSENAKLKVGDTFVTTHFLKNYPLFIDRILRNGDYTPSYVAGKTQGLNYLEVLYPESEGEGEKS